MALLAIDTETTGVDWHDDAFMISVAAIGMTTGDVVSHVIDKREINYNEWNVAILAVTNSLKDSDRIIMHNAKFDLQKLNRLGIPMDVMAGKFEDTQAIAHLLDEHQSTGLKYLSRVVLGEETDEDEILKTYRRKNKLKKEDGYEQIPNEILAPYAAKDAEFTLRLYETLMPRLEQHEDLMRLYKLEKELTLCLLDVEASGMMIDREYVMSKRKEYGDRIYATKQRIGEIAGEEFNPRSPKQILETFAQRGVRVDATDKATLSEVDDELAGLIVELRESDKIKATYFDALWEESKRDSVLHPNFRQHGTRTGRMSSGAAQA